MTEAPLAASGDGTADFDEFYRTTRDRLLLQTFALTGDLTAARSGVRDAFVVAWHHWRKTSRTTDPEAAVRATAWRHAQRRATARRWRRDQAFDAEVCAVLDELADLSLVQRKMLILTQLAGTSLPAAAREVALPVESASRELGTGAADFARVRAIETVDIPAALAVLTSATRPVRWPRVTIIRRAGGARRRAHTVAGAVTVAAVLVIGGIAVNDSTGVRSALPRDSESTTSSVVAEPQVVLPDTELLPVGPVRQTLTGKRWEQRRTSDNSEGDGRVLACQQERYADPDGEAAWVRRFREAPAGKSESRHVVQVAEASAGERSAQRSYRRMRNWMAGCLAEPAQKQRVNQNRLAATYVVQNVGAQAHLFLLRNDQTKTTYVTALARTGRLVTAISLETTTLAVHADREGVAQLLSAAVGRMCRLPAAGRCASKASLAEVPPIPAGETPALLSAWDLPPAGEDTGPWVGPPAVDLASDNGRLGVVSCSMVEFTGKYDGADFRHGALRNFVLPDAELPVEFGVTQMAASLPAGRAGAFVEETRSRIEDCPDSDAGAGTEVQELARNDEGDRSLTVWQLRTDLPDDRVLTYDMAILRDGSAISTLLFVSAPDVLMNEANFIKLAERALARLGEQPGHGKKG